MELKDQLKAALDELGVKYRSNASEETLKALYDNAMGKGVEEGPEKPREEVKEEPVVKVKAQAMENAADSKTFTERGVKYQKFFDKEGNTLKVIRF